MKEETNIIVEDFVNRTTDATSAELKKRVKELKEINALFSQKMQKYLKHTIKVGTGAL